MFLSTKFSNNHPNKRDSATKYQTPCRIALKNTDRAFVIILLIKFLTRMIYKIEDLIKQKKYILIKFKR